MNRPCAGGLALFGVALSLAFPAQAQVDADETETVLVTGEQPGPGLWKVSRDGHVMWVLGSIAAVPETIAWRTKDVEAAIAGSQEVLYPGWVRVGLDIGILRGMTLLPAAMKAAKNPNDATLKDVLPAETYAKWLALRQKYLGDDDDVERYRPMIVEDRLMDAIERKHRSPVPFVSIQSVVNKVAKKHKVKVSRLPTVTRKFGVSNPRAILKAARKMDLPEGECFDRNLDRIQRAVDEGRFSDNTSINAWATGDLETLRKRPGPAFWREDCTMVALNAVLANPPAGLPEGVAQGVDVLKKQSELYALASREAEENWLNAAEAALARNQSTFAVLPMNNVLSPTGFLVKLRERGYTVEEPT